MSNKTTSTFTSSYDTNHVKDARAAARTIHFVAARPGKPETLLLDQLEMQLAHVVVQANLRGQTEGAEQAGRAHDA